MILSEGRRQKIERLPRQIALRRNLLMRQRAIEHVHSRGNEVVVLDGRDHSTLSRNTEEHGRENVAQSLARRARHARRDIGNAVVNDATLDEGRALVARQA